MHKLKIMSGSDNYKGDFIDRMGHCCVNLVDMATDEAGIGLLIDYGNDHENEGKSEKHET